MCQRATKEKTDKRHEQEHNFLFCFLFSFCVFQKPTKSQILSGLGVNLLQQQFCLGWVGWKAPPVPQHPRRCKPRGALGCLGEVLHRRLVSCPRLIAVCSTITAMKPHYRRHVLHVFLCTY